MGGVEGEGAGALAGQVCTDALTTKETMMRRDTVYRLASGVPYWKLIQIQERKDTFFKLGNAQRCNHLGSFRVGNVIFVVFTNLLKRYNKEAEIKPGPRDLVVTELQKIQTVKLQ